MIFNFLTIKRTKRANGNAKERGNHQPQPPNSFWNGNFAHAISWVIPFLTAAFGSVYAEDIKQTTFPSLVEKSNLPPNWYAIGFGIATFASVALLLLIRHYNAKRQDYLYAAQLSSPPTTFYSWYDEACNSVRDAEIASETAMDEKKLTAEEKVTLINKNIRGSLDAIVSLIKVFDSFNINKNVIYRANVMKVVYFDKSPEHQIPTGSAANFFFPPAKELYSGIVELTGIELTTTSATLSPEPDKERKPIAFPFILDEEGDEHTNRFKHNLVGAPTAVYTNHYSYVHSTSEIVDSADRLDPTSETIKEKLRKYYTDPKNPALSILSIPVHHVLTKEQNAGEDPKPRPKYILNLYRNLEGLLFDGVKVDDFVQLLTPLIISLYTMLELRDELLETISIENQKGLL